MNHTINPGKPGIVLMIGAFLFQYLQAMTKSDIAFILSSASAVLAIVYYLIQIRKSIKK